MRKELLFFTFIFLFLNVVKAQDHFTDIYHSPARVGDELFAKRIVAFEKVEDYYWALVEVGQNISPQAAGHLPVEHKKKYGFEQGRLVAVGGLVTFPGMFNYVKTTPRGWLPTDVSGWFKSYVSVGNSIESDGVIWMPATLNGNYLVVNQNFSAIYKALSYKYKHGFMNLVTGYGSIVVKYENVNFSISKQL